MCLTSVSVVLQVVVVQAISALCQKYPRKHSVMMTFLSNMLRDDVCLKLPWCSSWQVALMVGRVSCFTSMGAQQSQGLSDYQNPVYLVGQTCLKGAYKLELVHKKNNLKKF